MLKKQSFLAAAGFFSFITVAESESPLPRSAELALDWSDGYQLLPITYEGLAKEVSQIFGEMGVNVQWADAGPTEEDESPTTRIRVILKQAESSGWSLPKHTMGVVIGKKVPRTAVYIFYPNVLKTLGLEPVPDLARSPRERALLTRALGRVVAHELVHAVVPEREHDSEGLLNSNLKRKHLKQSHLRLVDETADAVVERLAAYQKMALNQASPSGE